MVRAMDAGALLDAGLIATLDAVAPVHASVIDGGPAHGCRAIDVRVQGGIDVRALPDRGLDIGAAWFRGVPLAWLSAVGERAPLAAPLGADWLAAFGGGLVTTCGLRNVGAASEGHGLHGTVSHVRARQVTIARSLAGGEAVVSISGVLDDVSALGPHLRLQRTLSTRTGSGRIELTDRTINLGAASEPAPLLYHVNLGAPLLGTATRVEIGGTTPVPRDDPASRAGFAGWRAPGGAVAGADEIVLEHLHENDAAPEGRARVVNPELDLAVTVTWERSGLPRLWQWIHRRAGIHALAIEPANCSVLGRAADRAAGRLPMLEPGEERVTRLRIDAAVL
jgi:hypothetical protein